MGFFFFVFSFQPLGSTTTLIFFALTPLICRFFLLLNFLTTTVKRRNHLGSNSIIKLTGYCQFFRELMSMGFEVLSLRFDRYDNLFFIYAKKFGDLLNLHTISVGGNFSVEGQKATLVIIFYRPSRFFGISTGN